MKKIIVSVAALFAFGFANAQDNTASAGKGFANGDVFISGSVGIGSEKEGDFKTSTFNIVPKVGFFVTDNIVLGGVIGYTSSTIEVVDLPISYEEKSSIFAIGAFGRYYATPASDFSFFGELGLTYSTSKVEDSRPLFAEYKENGFDIALSPGVSYFISDHFALEAAIGALRYTTSKPDYNNAESADTFGLDLNLSDIKLGLVYKF